jgi:hypothetical protein
MWCFDKLATNGRYRRNCQSLARLVTMAWEYERGSNQCAWSREQPITQRTQEMVKKTNINSGRSLPAGPRKLDGAAYSDRKGVAVPELVELDHTRLDLAVGRATNYFCPYQKPGVERLNRLISADLVAQLNNRPSKRSGAIRVTTVCDSGKLTSPSDRITSLLLSLMPATKSRARKGSSK